ncbi:MAG: SPFH domain-containing protein [Candidatus Woesearchaeota archaeon]
MLGIGYFKAEPTEYARITVGGKVKAEGQGIAGYFLQHHASIELVGTTVVDKLFDFREVSSDNQEVNLQGGLLYRVTDPAKILSIYNHAINPKTRNYLVEDPTKLQDFIQGIARTGVRRYVQPRKLEELLTAVDPLSIAVFEEVASSGKLTTLGIEVTSFYLSAITPSEQIAKALGATYREAVLQTADNAAFIRRTNGITNDKTIKETELNNRAYLAEKEKGVLALEGQNVVERATHEASAERARLGAYDGMSADLLRAHALLLFGRNAANIQNFSVTPEMLGAMRSMAPN